MMDNRLEIRYVVIKLAKLDYDQLVALDELLEIHGIPTIDCVVIEQDWPEYQPTVDSLIERIKNGTPRT